MSGPADHGVVVDKHFDHVRQLISLRESTGKSVGLTRRHRRLRAAVTAPLRELDRMMCFGTLAKAVTADARPR